MYRFWFVNMPTVTADATVFFHILCLKRYSLIKLLQIVCLGRSVNLCNHLWLYQSCFYYEYSINIPDVTACYKRLLVSSCHLFSQYLCLDRKNLTT